jgi:hypothetical protein
MCTAYAPLILALIATVIAPGVCLSASINNSTLLSCFKKRVAVWSRSSSSSSDTGSGPGATTLSWLRGVGVVDTGNSGFSTGDGTAGLLLKPSCFFEGGLVVSCLWLKVKRDQLDLGDQQASTEITHIFAAASLFLRVFRRRGLVLPDASIVEAVASGRSSS